VYRLRPAARAIAGATPHELGTHLDPVPFADHLHRANTRFRMSSSRISILALVVSLVALVRLVATHSIFGTEPISIGVQVAAALFMLAARWTFGMRSFHAAANPTEGQLVTSGPFAIVRNPIYAAVILFTWTGVATHWSVENALLGIVIASGMLVRILAEERLLRARYGAEYSAYETRVKRLIPLVF
jgi:protein-S-isoprenylcysteine O-methyltransferase Ste14